MLPMTCSRGTRNRLTDGPHEVAAAAGCDTSHRWKSSTRRAYADVADVPEQQAVNIRNRSYAIGSLVDIPGN
ncbi:hypothetical protein AB0F91_46490, partial [Amycolatopsis sp. NPDC023774]|uniref:hypothetical protein n=1 Tax=Amycolatopsis sp. NPDC023774 TaxID=3155015 RepID=UPI0033F73477